jgi:hypothetical protein
MTGRPEPTDQEWLPDELDSFPQRAAPRRRWGSAAVALLLMLLGAAGALWLSPDGAHRVDVVALARPLARGAVVTPADLAVVAVDARGGPVRLASPQLARGALVGRPVLLDLPAGTLLSPEMVGSVAVPAGQATIGVTVPPEGLPGASVRPGDVVGVLGTDPVTGQAAVLVRDAHVAGVRSQAVGSRPEATVVYLTLPEQAVGAVEAAAMSEHGVRLIGIGGGEGSR